MDKCKRRIQTLEDNRACVPFEVLYGRKCRPPVLWVKIRESSFTGLELVQETTDKRFDVGDRYVNVDAEEGEVHLERRAYRLRLLGELNSVHDTFHVSNLKKCLAGANLHVPLDEIKVDKTLRFVKEPVEIMDEKLRS
ncbi:hypothetical protein Tco_1522995 [Tanacetum coccineum]